MVSDVPCALRVTYVPPLHLGNHVVGAPQVWRWMWCCGKWPKVTDKIGLIWKRVSMGTLVLLLQQRCCRQEPCHLLLPVVIPENPWCSFQAKGPTNNSTLFDISHNVTIFRLERWYKISAVGFVVFVVRFHHCWDVGFHGTHQGCRRMSISSRLKHSINNS
jgi:hypothetical protein